MTAKLTFFCDKCDVYDDVYIEDDGRYTTEELLPSGWIETQDNEHYCQFCGGKIKDV